MFKGILREYLCVCLCGQILLIQTLRKHTYMPSTLIQTHTAAKINCKLQVNFCFRLALHNWHCHWFPKRREPWCTMGQQKQHQGRGSESTVRSLLPPFSAPVSCQRDTAVWLGDKKRIIVVRRWRNNIGPAQPICVQDNYFLIVHTDLLCFVLSQIQNMQKRKYNCCRDC